MFTTAQLIRMDVATIRSAKERIEMLRVQQWKLKMRRGKMLKRGWKVVADIITAQIIDIDHMIARRELWIREAQNNLTKIQIGEE